MPKGLKIKYLNDTIFFSACTGMQEWIITARFKTRVMKMVKKVKKTQIESQSQTLRVRAMKVTLTNMITKNRYHISKKHRATPKFIPTMNGIMIISLSFPSSKCRSVAQII